MSVKSIYFVCTGNICRSPMAEVMLRHMLKKEGVEGIEIASRGVYAEDGLCMTDPALAQMRALGIDGRRHVASQFTKTDADTAGLILVMEHSHREWIIRKFPWVTHKTHLLSAFSGAEREVEVDDPYGGSTADYEKCRMEIQNYLLDLLPKLKGSTP